MQATVLSHLLTTLVSLFAGLFVIRIRMRAGDRPTNLKKIIIPPLGMATGFAMFFVPAVRIPWEWGLAAFAAGAVLFAFPLIQTSKLHIVDGDIYIKRSKVFAFIIVALLLLRVGLHDVVEQYISLEQTAAVFFILAFGMLLPWRLAMTAQYLAARRTLNKSSANRKS
ncbi:CcdC family protein [Paenibacillus gansuensis]|uniref:CcdC family protein n=1 Tax=Paenibacillus gansuensis TaxID=306542 RepID=A0ABW5PL45_9BACL